MRDTSGGVIFDSAKVTILRQTSALDRHGHGHGEGTMRGMEDSGQRRAASPFVRVTLIFTALGVLFTALTLARDVSGWDLGWGKADRSAAPTRTPEAGPVNPPGSGPAKVAPAGSPTAVRLDTLPVEAGAANLVKLPRQLVGRPEYDRSIVINCPRNTGSDKQREVTYRLQRRFLDLTATVRPYFPSPDDRDGAVLVYAQVTIHEKDDTVTRVVRGQQFEARMDAPRDLVADVEGADELVLRIQCEFPDGAVVFTGASVTAG
ncbi:hypothetical protein [Micromonospora echinofusca]|uniref:hypothetical protein n=1 Tax=Micromonospora echinofusca TaxID=47858 RepID=UPI0018D566EA|nr:hypothetical protein [Micromonospora echinofusca]